jgi:putative ABC transport system permease protein
MSFLRLVWVNLRRHWVRTLLGVAGIAFGCAAMLTILSIVLGAIGMFERILETDAQVLVFERNVSDLFFSSVPDSAARALTKLPGVAAAHPVLFGIVSAAEHPIVTCFGVERDNPRLAHAVWLAGTRERFGAPGEVVVGERAAAFLRVTAGDRLTLGHQAFTVGGVIRTANGFEDGGVFLPLAAAQEFFHRPNLASVVAVQLTDSARAADFKAAVARDFPALLALENREFAQGYSQFRILKLTGWAVGVCAFLLGGLGVANTMLMSVFTRIREFAVLRVCGFSRGQVARLVVAEALAIAGAGLAAGLALGFGVLAGIEALPQLNGYVQASVRPAVLAGIAGTALLTALAGALYPAWFATRIQAAEALRYE